MAPFRGLILMVALASVSGCGTLRHAAPPPPPAAAPRLPGKYEVRVGRYLFLSDAELTAQHPMLKSLETLQEQISTELRLPPSDHLIHVYLFADKPAFEAYMQHHFRDLPARRAFFMARTDVRRGDELMVFGFWGDHIRDDLRHELTHATLHGILRQVPLWLDEGLAEFFEVDPSRDGVSQRHLLGFRQNDGPKTEPDLERLERLTQVQEMGVADYREAWAWVHFCLRGQPEARKVLLQYLQHLRREVPPDRLETRLRTVLPDPAAALKRHLRQLDAATRLFPGEAHLLPAAAADPR
jgi:hypothetical protein